MSNSPAWLENRQDSGIGCLACVVVVILGVFAAIFAVGSIGLALGTR